MSERQEDERASQKDDVVVILVVVRSLPTSFVQGAYDSHHPVDLSSPALSRLAEDEYRTGC